MTKKGLIEEIFSKAIYADNPSDYIVTYRDFEHFKQINLKLNHLLVIECDNQQTIRLIKLDQLRIKTQLRHVDIHNCWVRQAYQQGQFQVTYTPTAEMVADGLTKALPGQKFQKFVEQLALVDIYSILEGQDNSDSD